MKNIWIISKKELKSYFASPIAYLLMAFFALIFGFGFYNFLDHGVPTVTARAATEGAGADLPADLTHKT